MLDRFGFEVLEAATGEEALAIVAGSAPAPHAVIADLTLPYDDLFQDYVRSHSIPYIVTVTTDDGVVPADAVAVLEKPFSRDTLLAAIFGVLRGGQSPITA
jgi:DNA-binding response OmpR family regulator